MHSGVKFNTCTFASDNRTNLMRNSLQHTILRLCLILMCILGISAIFMPWLYFPKADVSFYGYKADGVVTGFLFLVILITTLLTIERYKLHYLILSFIGLIGLLLAYITYRKMDAIEIERSIFTHENSLVVEALAGTQLGIGVYLSGIAGLAIFFLSILIFFEQYFFRKEATINSGVKKYHNGLLASLVLITILGYAFYHFGNKTIDENTIKTKIEANITSMGLALSEGRYDEFINYNHPLMVNSTGGKEKMTQAVKEALESMRESGSTLKTIKLKSISQVSHEGKNIQAILSQVVMYDTNGIETSDEQKMIAISEDNGDTFQFINITNKSKKDLIKFFPDLNQNLEF